MIQRKLGYLTSEKEAVELKLQERCGDFINVYKSDRSYNIKRLVTFLFLLLASY